MAGFGTFYGMQRVARERENSRGGRGLVCLPLSGRCLSRFLRLDQPSLVPLLCLLPLAFAPSHLVHAQSSTSTGAVPSANSTNPEPSSSSSPSTALIAIISAAVVVVVGAVVTAIAVYVLRRRRGPSYLATRNLRFSTGPTQQNRIDSSTSEGNGGVGGVLSSFWSSKDSDDAVGLQADGAALAIANRERMRMLRNKEREERRSTTLLRDADANEPLTGNGTAEEEEAKFVAAAEQLRRTHTIGRSRPFGLGRKDTIAVPVGSRESAGVSNGSPTTGGGRVASFGRSGSGRTAGRDRLTMVDSNTHHSETSGLFSGLEMSEPVEMNAVDVEAARSSSPRR
ncbi:hypothetical protein HDU93_005948 [Gonapodya sp. JEL0774]|nr:hypothetical protein HDU93_005948 [Gonapodya sp. JEL0774]